MAWIQEEQRVSGRQNKRTNAALVCVLGRVRKGLSHSYTLQAQHFVLAKQTANTDDEAENPRVEKNQWQE